ncbi:urease accessory protein UreF [Undibacterium sp. RTI2.1]|uniref:urease accessory protein UreF n=1 Tax=unclassified Undibacterium TaxID=2630295 RepID=UPI002AB3F143|nr:MULTISPECIES: urease accessory protein UreF [unclassified Undibacterium]MDY7536973.1 urease accessory protein UreF [Undibacterium sp. 5I1]MEB0032652.1 urease accessory protein UreF [Undibacterium sp. RTI2.1]MEB0118006.1 urease accessory protein UreF [Undibacterium sp. RTI2.2]MEB0229495.1 urease accessory protein UreF [Undibacterium sp. 10I3]MEB0258848.1 urease accessory protein UreF [Undibacterium sp. 5I1]
MQTTALLHLLQLASPSLPVGAYSYSQGLESAIEQGLVKNSATARLWISQQLVEVLACFEAPILWRLLHAFEKRDQAAVSLWTERFLAARDTAEFRAETVQMGYSLGKLLVDLKLDDSQVDPALLACLQSLAEVPFPTALACSAVALKVPAEAALLGMLFSWAENQVLVCVKSVPLGQVAGQALLLSLTEALEAAAKTAQTLNDDELSSWAPGLSLLSMQHEVQYSRLYRS